MALGIGKQVDQLFIGVGLNPKEFDKGLKSVTKKINGAGKKMMGVGKTFTKSVSAPILAFGVASVIAWDKQAKAIAQVEAGLKSTGGQVGLTTAELQKAAQEIQSNSIFGDEEIMTKATANLLTFTNISGEAFIRTQQVAVDLSQKIGTDLTSSTIMLGKALNDPVANMGALGRAGIQFSVEQKEVIKALAEGGRLADAQTIILGELETQFGGAAAAAAAAGAGPFQQLMNTVGDMTEMFGKIITEALIPLAAKFKAVTEKIMKLSPEKKKLIVVIAAIAAALPPLIFGIGALMAVINPWAVAIGLVVAAVALLIIKWKDIKAWIDTKMPIIGRIMDNVWIGVKDLFVSVVEAFKFGFNVIWKAFDWWIHIFTSTWDIFKALFSGDWAGLWEGVKNLFSGMWDRIKDAFAAAIQGIMKILPGFVKDWLGITEDVAGGADDIAEKLEEDVPDAAKTAVDAVGDSPGGLASEMGKTIGALEDGKKAAEELAGKDENHGLKAVSKEAFLLSPIIAGLGTSIFDVAHVQFGQSETEIALRVDGMKAKLLELPATITNDLVPVVVDMTPWQQFRAGAGMEIDALARKVDGPGGITAVFTDFGASMGLGPAGSGIFGGVFSALGSGSGLTGVLTNLASTVIPGIGPAFAALAPVISNIVSGITSTVQGLSDALGFGTIGDKLVGIARDKILPGVIKGLQSQGVGAEGIFDQIIAEGELFGTSGLSEQQLMTLIESILWPGGRPTGIGTAGVIDTPVPVGVDENGNPIFAWPTGSGMNEGKLGNDFKTGSTRGSPFTAFGEGFIPGFTPLGGAIGLNTGRGIGVTQFGGAFTGSGSIGVRPPGRGLGVGSDIVQTVIINLDGVQIGRSVVRGLPGVLDTYGIVGGG